LAVAGIWKIGISYLAMLSQRPAFFGDGGPGKPATQALEFAEFVCLGRADLIVLTASGPVPAP